VSEQNVFELVKLIKAANGDPSSITDAIGRLAIASRNGLQKKPPLQKA
jgi:hypothetical protein